MSLSAFQPKREAISVSNQNEPLFHVRALGLTDVASVIESHLHDLDALFMRISTGGDVFAPGVGDNIMLMLVKDAPEIAAHIISLAADEPEAIEQARRLPAPVQLEALVKTFNLTFTDYGGPKKFFETVMGIYQAAKSNGLISSATPSRTPTQAIPTPRPNRKTRRS